MISIKILQYLYAMQILLFLKLISNNFKYERICFLFLSDNILHTLLTFLKQFKNQIKQLSFSQQTM